MSFSLEKDKFAEGRVTRDLSGSRPQKSWHFQKSEKTFHKVKVSYFTPNFNGNPLNSIRQISSWPTFKTVAHFLNIRESSFLFLHFLRKFDKSLFYLTPSAKNGSGSKKERKNFFFFLEIARNPKENPLCPSKEFFSASEKVRQGKKGRHFASINKYPARKTRFLPITVTF